MSAAVFPLPDLFASDDWLTLLDISLTGIHLLRPVYEPDGSAIVDFAIEYLNPAAQRMTGLGEQPGGTLLGRFPHAFAGGIFQYYRRVFETGEHLTYETNYQADGLDNFFRFSARRSGAHLLVSFTDTSDQHRSAVEQALRKSQAAEQAAHAEAELQRQRFREVLTQMPAYIAVYQGPDHVYQFVNPAYQSLFPHRSFLGRPFREGTPEAVELGVVALFDQVYQTGETVYLREMEGWFDFHGNGQPVQVFLNISLHPLRNVQGHIDGVMDFTYDVSQQVRARQQVEQLNQELETRVQQRTHESVQQQQLLSHILDQVPAAVATLSGPEHRFTFFNDRYQTIVAGRAQLGVPLVEAIPEIMAQGFSGLLDAVYTTGQPFIQAAVPVQLYDPATGTLVAHYVDLNYQPLRDEQGVITGILAFVLNVTEAVLARQQAATLQAELLATAERQAREREEFYQVFEQAPVVVALLRGPGHFFHYRNPAFQALFPERALTGHLYAEVMPEIVAAGLMPELDRVYATGQPYYGTAVPFVTTPPGGTIPEQRYYDFSYQPTREHGHTVGISIFAYDVTEQAQARQQVQALNEELAAINEEMQATNEELNDTNTQLQRTNADLDTFVYAASHDLKSPIANVEGLLEALRDYLPTLEQEPMVPRLVGMMQDAIRRFQQTVAHLTDVTRLQAGEEPVTGDVDVPGILEDVRLDLLPLLESAQTQLLVDVPACPDVRIPVKHLRSILFNLLSNAVKYRAPARPPVVQVRAQCAAGQFVLEVQDNGLGLSQAQQGDLFTMFRRLHTHVEGSGVGLYLIRRMIELAGGSITVASQPGVGSTFTVTLPRA